MIIEDEARKEEVRDSDELYIVSNPTNLYGASAILDKKAIRQFSMKIGVDKWIVLPSSLHEMLITPYYDEVKNIVQVHFRISTGTKSVNKIAQLAIECYNVRNK